MIKTMNNEIKFNDKVTGKSQKRRGHIAIFNDREKRKIRSLPKEFTFNIKHLNE